MEPSGDRLRAALNRLVERGTLDPHQADAVLAEVGGRGPRPALRRLLAEIAGYLGAAFVVGAAMLFVSDRWDQLDRPGRVALLGGMAVVLAGAGAAVRWRGRPTDDLRRRLASTLLTGASLAAGFAAYAGVERAGRESAVLVAGLVALAVVTGGQVLAGSAFGQLGIAVAGFVVMVGLLDLIDADAAEAYGTGMLVLGVLWAVSAGWRLVAAPRWALATAVTFALAGAQTMLIGDRDALGYGLTALVSAVCFVAYARMRDWIVLAGGVAGATVAVPEFADDVMGGTLDASGVLLVAGITLLAAGLTGLRIHRNPGTPAAPDPA